MAQLAQLVSPLTSCAAKVIWSPYCAAYASICQLSRRARAACFSLPPSQITFTKRGFFESSPEVTVRLERVGLTFLAGFRSALVENSIESCANCLESEIDSDWRGFGYEGAAFGFAILDAFTPWKAFRWRRFAEGPACSHIYMIHVGFGMALAELPFTRARMSVSLRAFRDPVLSWLAIDGFGFHHGFFYSRRNREIGAVRNPLKGEAAKVFDQGLGRSLWFVMGAEATRLEAWISSRSGSRQSDLWAGVGLAAAYAGGIEGASLERLLGRIKGFRPAFAQGVAFAAKARQRAGNPAAHTETAARIACGVSACEAAQVTDACLFGLDGASTLPSYQQWRAKIRESFQIHFQRGPIA
jgi:enediyne biosynthesis protein E3